MSLSRQTFRTLAPSSQLEPTADLGSEVEQWKAPAPKQKNLRKARCCLVKALDAAVAVEGLHEPQLHLGLILARHKSVVCSVDACPLNTEAEQTPFQKQTSCGDPPPNLGYQVNHSWFVVCNVRVACCPQGSLSKLALEHEGSCQKNCTTGKSSFPEVVQTQVPFRTKKQATVRHVPAVKSRSGMCSAMENRPHLASKTTQNNGAVPWKLFLPSDSGYQNQVKTSIRTSWLGLASGTPGFFRFFSSRKSSVTLLAASELASSLRSQTSGPIA